MVRRILFVTRKWPPAMGGMETWSVEVAAALGEVADVEVRALPGQADGSPPSGGALVVWGLRQAVGLIGGGRVLHLGDMALWPLALFWRGTIAISAHGTDVGYAFRPGFKPRVYGWYQRLGARLLRRARVISNSAATEHRVTALGWRSAGVIPLATRMEVGAEVAPQTYILFVGRMIRRKGVKWFAEHVLPNLPDLRLKIAGTVWEADEAPHGDRIDHLGPVRGRALADLRREALCVISPNIPGEQGDFEGFGLTATEAAAAGGVSLAADIDGLTEAVVDGVTGFLLPAGDADAWTARITEIADWPPETRAAFLRTAQQETAQRYAWERVATDILSAYEDRR